MAAYRVRVSTGPQALAGTMDAVAITLVGTRGRSPRTPLDRWGPDFACGSRGEYRLVSPRALGRLLVARVHKGPFGGLPESPWFLEELCVWREGTEPPPDTPDEDTEDEDAEDEDAEDAEDTEDEDDWEDAGDSEEEEEEEEEEGDATGDTGDAEGDVGDAEGGTSDTEGDAGDAAGDAGDVESDAVDMESDAVDAAGDTGDAEGDTGAAMGDAGDGEGDTGDAERDASDTEGDTGDMEGDAGATMGDAGDGEGDTGDAEGDTGAAMGDAGGGEGDISDAEGDAVDAEGDAGDVESDAGDTAGDAGDAEGDAGAAAGDAGDVGGDAGAAAGDAGDGEGDAVDATGDAVDAEGDAGDAEGDAGPPWGTCGPEDVWEAEATGDSEEEEDDAGEEAGDAGDAAGDADDVGPFYFPCYRWLRGYGTWELAEGTAKTPAQECHPLLQRLRRRHLLQQRRRYRLAPTAPGLPWGLPLGTPPDPDLRYSLPKAAAFYLRGGAANLEAKLRGFLDRPHSWESLDAIARVFCCFHTPVTEYVVQHWQDDAFFGEQYLSGVNPLLLRRCSRLPPNFPVTPPMVAPSLGPHTCLQREMEEGNIYLADYGVLEGLPTAHIDGRPTYVAAPLCLLHQRPDGELRPIAIQLSQRPGVRSPLFVPSDAPWLWATAKTWVRSAEFHLHEGLSHLLRAHLLGEVYAMATLRHLPPPHPLFKLLVPHTRFTVHIAALARRFLLNPGGVFDRAVALGRRGLLQLVARGLRDLHYDSLVLPRDLRRRGVTRTRRYYFADDARRIWAAIRSFVRGIVGLYYPSDAAVRGDAELQAWVGEIFHRGFLGRRRSGVPSRLSTIPRLVTFLTMVIYSCSAHHAATNSGQFELGAFMPNMPAAMREPPPETKEPLTEEQFLAALPAMNTTAITLGVLWVLRNEPFDMRPLGCYPERHFTEDPPRRLMRLFRRRLRLISRRIRRRNAALPRPYAYLDPPSIENSVAV